MVHFCGFSGTPKSPVLSLLKGYLQRRVAHTSVWAFPSSCHKGALVHEFFHYADFNLLKFPDKAQAMEKIKDLTMLSDIFPSGYHGAFTAGVTAGSTVYIAGGGPVGLACAAAAQLLGAAVVSVGDMNPERLAQARSFGCETNDLTQSGELPDMIQQILCEPGVDAAVDSHG